jgi:chemotaxis protein CheY-P-specific phosphatase CheC
MDNQKLHELFKNTFNEAANSLSQLIDIFMLVSEYRVAILSGEEFMSEVDGQLENSYFASIVKSLPEFHTSVVSLISEKDGLRLYNLILGNDTDPMNDVSQEVIAGIGELNNIVGSTFINCMANITRKKIYASIPLTTFDMLGAILEGIVLQEEFIHKAILCADAIIKNTDKDEFYVRQIIMSDKDQLLKLVNRN